MARRPRGPIKQKTQCLVGFVGPLMHEFWYHPRQLAVRQGAWYIRDGQGWSLYRAAPQGGDMPKPITDPNILKGVAAPRKPSQVFAKFKELASYFSDTLWPDGTAMGSVQVSFRTRGHAVIAQMKLGDHGGLRVTAEGEHLDDALMALESLLGASPVPWERDPYPLDAQVKKPKK